MYMQNSNQMNHQQQASWYPQGTSDASSPHLDTRVPNIIVSSPDEGESSCVTSSLKGLATGFVGGSLLGAIFSNWSDQPITIHNQRALPALQKTGSLMMQHGSTLGAVGLAYAAVDCAAESIRGERDWFNGVLGGVAGGTILGLRSGNPRLGFVSMLALGATSAAVDASGWKLTGAGCQDEHTPVRRVYPYNS